MSEIIVSHPCHCCHDCGQPLDCQCQQDGRGGSYLLVTCWNPDCMLRTVTRSLDTYTLMQESDFAAYREMNRKRDEVCCE